MQRAVSNAVYSEVARVGFQTSGRLAVGWDGSTHGSKDVSMGYGLAVDSTFMAYTPSS